MAMALKNRKSYRARPGIETWPETASRNKNDPAKTHAAACFKPNTRNSQIPAAHRGPRTRESARSVKSKSRLGAFIGRHGNDIMEHGEAATDPAPGPGH